MLSAPELNANLSEIKPNPSERLVLNSGLILHLFKRGYITAVIQNFRRVFST
jgi:hypothetical protein